MAYAAEDLQFQAGPAACAGCLLWSEAPCCTLLYEPFPHRPHPDTWRSGSNEGTLLSQKSRTNQKTTIHKLVSSSSGFF